MFRSASLRLACIVWLTCAIAVQAHDTWVQTNTAIVRPGDAVHIDLMLGNHGNDHRDFKIAGKVGRDSVDAFDVVAPDGKKYDLRPSLVDLGYAPKEGFLTARFVPAAPGLHVAAQTSDKVVNHGKPIRSYRSAKAYFLVSPSLDKIAKNITGFDRVLGHKIELVPEANPVAPAGPEIPIKVKLLYDGKPLPDVKVSFIPRGIMLKEGTDETYERTTDKDGRASFTPNHGNYYLVVAHYRRDDSGPGYEASLFTATLTVLVPETCPCCD